MATTAAIEGLMKVVVVVTEDSSRSNQRKEVQFVVLGKPQSNLKDLFINIPKYFISFLDYCAAHFGNSS